MSVGLQNARYGRTYLLASVAALATVGTGFAADLPSHKAAPASYVKICDAYGAGFFTIPGSDTCLKVGGFVRFEAQYTPGQAIRNVGNGAISQVSSAQDSTGMETRGSIALDARTPTEWGTARTYLRMRILNAAGVRSTSGPANFDLSTGPTSGSKTGNTLERAYISWAGFTFGLMNGEYAALWPSGSYVGGSADFTSGWTNGIKGISYKKSFAGGWTAAVEIHSRSDGNVQNASSGNPLLPVPYGANDTNLDSLKTGYNLTGDIRNEGPWGGIELSAMVGNNSVSASPLPSAITTSKLKGSDTQTSWAVNSTLQVNLPMLAKGDAFFFNIAYGVGADGYVGAVDSVSTLVTDSGNRRVLGGVLIHPSNLSVTSVDAAGNPLTYGQEREFQATALLTHFWAPQWRSHFSVAYAKYSTPTAAGNGGILNTQLGDVTVWATKGNLIFSPVKDLDIGVEVGYGRDKATIQNPTAAFLAAGSPGLSNGNWISKLRVQRTF